MKTVLIEPDEYMQAVDLLASEKLVVIPTETVYGLGASALSDMACRKVYKVKERPEDNPLIVHCADIPMALLCIDSDDISAWWALKIMSSLAPSPVTVIAKASNYICKTALAGGDTVAVRIPDHRLCHHILVALGVPVAAPSANISGMPSATNALMAWEALCDNVVAVVDGGQCRIGLESTIIDCTHKVPQIVRLGAMSTADISEAIHSKIKDFDRSVYSADEEKFKGDPSASLSSNTNIFMSGRNTKMESSVDSTTVPGSKYRHYSPICKIVPIINWNKTEVLVKSSETSLLQNDSNANISEAQEPFIDVSLPQPEKKFFSRKKNNKNAPNPFRQSRRSQKSTDWVDARGSVWNPTGNTQRVAPQNLAKREIENQNWLIDNFQSQQTVPEFTGLCVVGEVKSPPPENTYILYRHYETYEELARNLYDLFAEADRRNLKELYIDCPKLKQYPALYDRLWRASKG